MNASMSPRGASPYFITSFKPSLWRYLAYQVVSMFAAYQVGYFLLNLIYPEMVASFAVPAPLWLLYSLVFTLVYAAAVAAMSRRAMEDFRISFSNGQIEGPSGKQRGRTRFSMDELDVEKTRQTSWQNRLFQYRHIWSRDGRRIVLLTHAFNPTQVRALLEKLGCASS